ncbi:MAG: ATP-dependent protease ATPase subunit HslU [Planctomycetota bacterium]
MALTPKEILQALDEYVVGQNKAKRAVAVALRNRWRRRQLPRELAADVYPKNILLIGPTGVGKTEIARRLADLARAPFVKVEASKYSEVGYHGRDVESMVRDLVESAVVVVRREHAERVEETAHRRAEERILEVLLEQQGLSPVDDEAIGLEYDAGSGLWRPALTASPRDEVDVDELAADAADATDGNRRAAAEALRRQLGASELEQEVIEIEVPDTSVPSLSITGPQGTEAMGIDAQALQEMWGRTPIRRTKVRRIPIAEARALLKEEEADSLIDQDAITREAISRAENDGIIFLDEIDKIVGAGGGDGPDVSREGVQRDLLPIIEGCVVYTRYGHVDTQHILFLAAGAFHVHKPSELIPELQGRFPVRVPLRALTQEDFLRILTEPRNSLVRQYQALFETEGVTLSFTADGLERLAALAFHANKVTQNIGARRLFTIMEKCLEELSFEAPDRRGEKVVVDAGLVTSVLGETADESSMPAWSHPSWAKPPMMRT